MYKIAKIYIKGFKDKERIVDLEFSDSQSSIIFGDNGCGKTTLLRIISAFMNHEENILMQENVSEIRVEFWTEDGQQEQYAEFVNGEDHKYKWSFDNTAHSSILFGVNRGISYSVNVSPIQIEDFFRFRTRKLYLRNSANIEMIAMELSDYLNRFESRNGVRRVRSQSYREIQRANAVIDRLDMTTVEELLTFWYGRIEQVQRDSVLNAFFNSLSEMIDGSAALNGQSEINANELMQYRGKLLEILKVAEENSLQNRMISLLENEDINVIIRECKNNANINILINKMLKELIEKNPITQTVNKIQQVFNENVIDNKKLIVDGHQAYVEIEDKSIRHSLSNLSSGEKQLLSLLTVSILIGAEKDIVMVDEPEISLNIKWKRKIMSLFEELLPNSQIIVATHSASIANEKLDSLVKM